LIRAQSRYDPVELQFLGTSSGTPTKTRNLSALALRSRSARNWYLIDCGEATQHRILHTSLSLCSLSAIFVTHVHGDHCYGIPGLLASAGMLNRTEDLVIAGPPAVEHFTRCALEATGLQLPYPLGFVHVEGSMQIRWPDFDVQVTPLSHRVPSFAYSFSEKPAIGKLDMGRLEREGVPRGPAWGQLQRGGDVVLPDGRHLRGADYLLPPAKPHKIIVGGDNDRPELLLDEARTAEVLIHEATYTEDTLNKIGPGPRHSSARRVARMAAAARIGNLVLTHFSPRYQEEDGTPALSEIEAEARAVYHGNLFLARDLDRYVLHRTGNLARSG